MPKAAKRKAVKTVAKAAARKTKPKRKPRMRAMTDKEFKTEPKPAPAPVVKEAPAGGTQGAYSETTSTVPPADLLTEQEKDVVGTGGTDVTAGVGPTTPAEHTTGPVETIEDQGIGPRTPYPVTDVPPPPPEADATKRKGPGK
jgi:hypothetical protein